MYLMLSLHDALPIYAVADRADALELCQRTGWISIRRHLRPRAQRAGSRLPGAAQEHLGPYCGSQEPPRQSHRRAGVRSADRPDRKSTRLNSSHRCISCSPYTTLFRSMLLLIVPMLWSCASARVGFQSDGTYVLERNEQGADCQALHKSISARIVVLKSLPAKAIAEQASVPPTAQIGRAHV